MDFEQRTTSSESSNCGGASHDAATAGSCRSGAPAKPLKGRGPDRRAEKRVDRRTGLDRRIQPVDAAGFTGPDRRVLADRRDSLERRRGPGRRLEDERKAAEEGEMTPYQFEFVQAIQTYKKLNKKMYPTFTELLEILQQLGYRKVLNRSIRIDAPEPKLFEAA